MSAIKLHIPTSFKEITVGQFQQYRKAIQGDFTQTRLKVITCSIFCNESIDMIESLTLASLEKVHSTLSKILESGTSDNLQRIIYVGGKLYGFIPNITQMSTGEFADLEEEIGDSGDVWDSLPEILSILYRPITNLSRRKWLRKTGTYEIEDYGPQHIAACDKMKSVDMECAAAVAVFFCNSANQLLMSSVLSLEENLQLRQMMD